MCQTRRASAASGLNVGTAMSCTGVDRIAWSGPPSHARLIHIRPLARHGVDRAAQRDPVGDLHRVCEEARVREDHLDLIPTRGDLLSVEALRADAESGAREDGPEAVESPPMARDLNDCLPRLCRRHRARPLRQGHVSAIGPRSDAHHDGDDHDEYESASEPHPNAFRVEEPFSLVLHEPSASMLRLRAKIPHPGCARRLERGTGRLGRTDRQGVLPISGMVALGAPTLSTALYVAGAGRLK